MMELVLTIATILNSIIVAIVVFNLFSVRVVKSPPLSEITEKVSILIPLRNERWNAEAVVRCALFQEGLKDFEVIALDDSSHDGTAEILQETSNPRFKLIQGVQLPESWLGKNFACHQLSRHANGEFFVFIDADVRLSNRAINNSIHAMLKWRWDFISPYPRQIAISFIERLAQPLLQWSWFATLPLRLAEVLQRKSMVVANGQFLITHRRAYCESGGHEAIKGEVLDDLELARSMVGKGFRGGVAEASVIAECRMYTNSKDLIAGYTKSQWRAFRNLFGAAIACALLIVTSLLPIALGLAGSLLGWINYFALVVTRLLVAIRTRSTVSSALLHPLSAALWIYLIALSWLRKFRGELAWRGRSL